MPTFPVRSNTLSPEELAKIKPPRSRKRASQWIRFMIWFNMYKRLFTIIVLFNFIGLICAAVGVWQYPRNYTSGFVLGNLLIAILVRTELFGRFAFLVVTTLFAKWPPLWFRLGISSILQHLGGVHTGCAISGTVWLLFRVCLITIDNVKYNPAIIATGFCNLVCLLIAMAVAIPWVRNHHHNVFEGYHRLVGWLGVLFTWLFTVLSDSYDLEKHAFDASGARVVAHQEFWFLLFMTICIIIPWLTVRKVPVEIEVPSPKVAVLKFKRGMQGGMLARVSHHPIMEFHAFGIISEGKNSDAHYLVAGVQGDFTRGLVENPPTHLYTRELKIAGISNTSTLYRRGVRVCTGTGIGAGLATCIQNPNWYLVWIGSDQLKTFGPTIGNMINKHLHPHRVTLWDTKERGCRPDTTKIVAEICKIWEAECVIVTSNLKGSTEIMEGLKDQGIACFGTLFDFCTIPQKRTMRHSSTAETAGHLGLHGT
ncbi:hypothetical protein BD626DRAFT_543984 [Schizophyllum amplum]|uniref:Non-ribosomal peptide synthetase n=1 Tax=Schizophyllum amplum TaxID=97359 RepID=A0A550CWG2_9AGAR|nr:hypothetical protein BD626DRAFT_543984 [Auriculariopsis ampla]